MAEDLRLQLADVDDPETAIQTMNTYLFEQMKFKAIPSDQPMSAQGNLLEEVVANRQGQCVGLSMLYLTLAQRLGLPVRGVIVPNHFFVRYEDPRTGFTRNIDLNLGGRKLSDSYYICTKRIAAEEVGTTYLKSLTPVESLAYLIHMRGYLRTMEGNFAEALKDHQLASQWVHAKVISQNFQGDVHAAQAESLAQAEPAKSAEQKNRALELYYQAIQTDQFFCPSYLNCARVLAAQGNLNSAIYECTRALKVNPDYPLALVFRAKYYYDNGQYSEALADFQTLEGEGPDSSFYEVAVEYIRLITPLVN